MVLQCCVSGCRNTSKEEKLYRFPYTDELVYNEWINRISNPKLKILSPQEVHKKYQVCHLHFHDVCKIDPKYYSKSGLKERSLLSINVPGFTMVATEENSFMSLENYKLLAEPILEASTSSDVEMVDVGTSLSFPIVVEDLPFTSDENISQKEDATVTHSAPVSSKKKGIKTISRKDLTKNFQILKAAGLRKKVQLPPKAKGLYHVAKRMRRIVREVETECDSLKERLKRAEAFVMTSEFLKATLNKVTFEFVCSQIKQQPKTPKGRRFTYSEKLFAVFNETEFKRLQTLRESICSPPHDSPQMTYQMGINEQVMDCIKATVSSLDNKSKYCVLAFDEMVLEAGVAYNSREDYIYGFERNNTTDFFDHVLVFMATGIYKKWKQPVAYFFSKGSVSSPKLGQYLREIIKALQNVGLRVIATVCDQFQSNCKVYNDLIRDTQQKYTRENREFRGMGFEIENEEIVPLFDPPHLLKGIRNNFLENDVSFLYNGKRQMAT